MTAIASVCVCTLEALCYWVYLDHQSLCHVRDFERSAVDHRAADHDIRHDVFAISHHGGVGSDAGDDQVKPHLGSLMVSLSGVKLSAPEVGISVHSIASPSSESSPSPKLYRGRIGVSR